MKRAKQGDLGMSHVDAGGIDGAHRLAIADLGHDPPGGGESLLAAPPAHHVDPTAIIPPGQAAAYETRLARHNP